MDGLKLSLRRGAAAGRRGRGRATSAAAAAAAARPPRLAASAPRGAPAADAPAQPRRRRKAGCLDRSQRQDVTSPLLGTFYRAPKPGAPPFVEVGRTVEEDTVVAHHRSHEADEHGARRGPRHRDRDPAADGALVEYGETLLRVSKAG